MKRLASSTCLALFLAASALAQQPDVRPYDTEEDVWEALREGEIDYDEFLELIDAHRVGTDGVFVPFSDWEELPGADAGYLVAPDTAQALTRDVGAQRVRGGPVRWSWRGGYDMPVEPTGDGDGYTLARFGWNNWRGLLDWQRDGGRDVWRRRTLMWGQSGVNIQLGSVEPRWGRGLVIGRRSRVISSSDLGDSFWQPSRSRFNGLWMATDERRTVSAGTLYSDMRSDSLHERVSAATLSLAHSWWRFGAAALSGEISNRNRGGTFSQRVYSVYTHIHPGHYELLAEFAADDAGHTAAAGEGVWRFERGQVHGRAWSYAKGFVNPWGGGPGHSDTRTVVLDDIDTRFASRTAGERGFDVAARLSPSRHVTWKWDWMVHREAATAPVEIDGVVKVRWQHGAFSLAPFLRGHNEPDQNSTYSFGSYADWRSRPVRVNARCEYGRHNTSADRFVRAGGGLSWKLSQQVLLAPALRWVDPDLDQAADGYWYFYCTETIRAAAASRIEIALAWQRYEDRGRGHQVELRLRVVGGFTTF